QIDVNTLEKGQADGLALNGIALCRLQLTRPVAFDRYRECRATGSLIVIDRLTNVTVGAGMVDDVAEPLSATEQLPEVTAEARARRLGQQPVQVTLGGPDVAALAARVERVLFAAGALPVVARQADADVLLAAGLVVIVADDSAEDRRLQLRCGEREVLVSSLPATLDEAAEQVLAVFREHRLLG
ncbi:MAG: sulfate adenylyltransferase subunit CysN, partial [Alcanivorax sp.]|nr:sulfate adenylyltransferase subunit CysN [Alcanivorax sp.]